MNVGGEGGDAALLVVHLDYDVVKKKGEADRSILSGVEGTHKIY